MGLEESKKLPPEDVIAQNLGVSRVTVKKSLTDLEQEGLIFRVHGRGTFVVKTFYDTNYIRFNMIRQTDVKY